MSHEKTTSTESFLGNPLEDTLLAAERANSKNKAKFQAKKSSGKIRV